MTHAEQVLLRYYAYFDMLVRKGTCSRLSGVEISSLEGFMEWLQKRYTLTERTRP